MTELYTTTKLTALDRAIQSVAFDATTEQILERAKQYAIFLQFDGVAARAD